MKSLLPEKEGLRRFLADQGWQAVDAIRQMGAANRHGVFLLERGDRRAVLKLHEPRVPGRRDAFAHEVLMHSFYAEEVAEFVPQLLAHDAGVRALLIDYVQGEPVSGPSKDDVRYMAGFLSETNRADMLDRARKRQLPPASESGSSAVEHWQCALLRLDVLLALHATDDATMAMQEFVRSEVRPALAAAKPDAGIAVALCLSPSDFGFHNVIRRADGSFCFIDFEHAGWDDPAKLAADFILQPDAPMAVETAEYFIAALQDAAGFGPQFADRVAQLIPIQKGKWTAIILNVFGRDTLREEDKAARLGKSMDYWRSHGTSGRKL
jgi:Ser/Thr protein kinase RdoA (MazF antagonist)